MLILIITLATLIVGCIKVIYVYYHSPDYVVDQYIDCLNKGQYSNLYKIIDSNSITDFSTKEELNDYYQKIYNRQHHLVYAFRKPRVNDPYYIQCQCEDKLFSYSLKLTHRKGKWYIQFPFQKSGIQVIAPYGSVVCVDQLKAQYNNDGLYEIKELLPANYGLAVYPSQKEYKPYYTKITIPTKKIYKAPYPMGTLKVNVPTNLKVQCHHFSQYASGGQVIFNNMLLGQYTININDNKGYIKPMQLDIQLEDEMHEVQVDKVELSNKGEQEIRKWLEKFYIQYRMGIMKHSGECIKDYFQVENRQKNIQTFNKWFINDKDIKEAYIDVDIEGMEITKSGDVDVRCIETVELINQELEDSVQVLKQYKLILYYHTVINILDDSIQIVDRYIDQNIIAVKSIDGEWIQY